MGLLDFGCDLTPEKPNEKSGANTTLSETETRTVSTEQPPFIGALCLKKFSSTIPRLLENVELDQLSKINNTPVCYYKTNKLQI